MILITSANGKTERHLIRRLSGKGKPVRALDISKESAQLKALGADEIVIGDMLDRSVLQRSMKGVSTMIQIGPPFHPKETEMGKAVIDAAAEAKIEHFIYFSVTHPQISALINHRAKLIVEEYLIDSGLNYTILQPMHYMQNISIKDVLHRGVVRMMYNLETRLSHVDMADVAEAAARVVREEGHIGATYELCGSDYISTNEIAAIIGNEAGHEIKAQLLPISTFLSFDGIAGLGEYGKDGLRRLFEYYGRRGILGNPNVLTWLLGRTPTTFAEYVRREIKE
jgi:uncharacterized protein YbjT (DUF2867 family)